MRELIPAIKGLWEGDYTHDGQYWQFPKTTSAPKPRVRSTFTPGVKRGITITERRPSRCAW